MFNPYIGTPEQSLRPAKGSGLLGGLMSKLKHLDSDDLLILALIFLLSRKDGEEGDWWPLAAMAIYLLLSG